ncbi:MULTISPECIES: RHE_PE00001 family protein [unclassified Sinorhizobium]|uniref:RHE_PE00001 family protein n=1 Tax=unclassified Sinorhizobium TaxID=2613772 RepID=UPI0024C329D5|nr:MULTISPECIES: RHE_PE00001 family protein [unclassified Sinorhizobium]MDK1377565.1 RHE_PE00001 family protein [Sinorhizobium sp. 6-70]MDK1480119.1 RHE_PE00001 family protein [Sinorhizobium sp. 6-117]
MRYETPDPLHPTLLPALIAAEDSLARLDERAGRHPVSEGFRERGQFFDAAAALWVAGELVHVEDLVLHDAHMDARAPSHELTIAHAVLRARRRLDLAEPDWALTSAGLNVLRGEGGAIAEHNHRQELSTDARRDTALAESEDEADENPLAAEFAELDAAIARSQRLLDVHASGIAEMDSLSPAAKASSEPMGQLGLLFEEDWDEEQRLDAWRAVLATADQLPASLGAAVLYDAWDRIEPLRRQHWLGSLLVGVYLRFRGKVSTHVLAFNTGLKTIRHERRRSKDRLTRLVAFLEAMTVTADLGMKELDRLSLAKTQMEMRIKDRRSSSNLPGLIDLVLSRPIVSTALIARHVGVTPRSALNLVRELGVREMTGRGRYRGWGVL